MATAGILRPNEVIFYHPLDNDFKENTVGEVWTGTPASVVGKIGQGESAVTSTAVALGALSVVSNGTVDNDNTLLSIAVLSSTSVVAAYASNAPNGDDTGKAVVGTITGTVIAWGTPVTFRTGLLTTSPSQQDVVMLSPTTVAVSYSQASPQGGFVRIGTVSGTTIAFGATNQFATAATDLAVRMAAMDSSHIVVLYKLTPFGGETRANFGTITGTSVAFGADSVFTTAGGVPIPDGLDIAALTPTKVVATSARPLRIKIGDVSGTNITWTTAITAGNVAFGVVSVAVLDATHFVASFSNSSFVGTVTGSSVVFGAQAVVPLGAQSINLTSLSPTTFVAAYTAGVQGGQMRVSIGSVSSGDVITYGTIIDYLPGGNGSNNVVAPLTSTSFVLGGEGTGTTGANIGDVFARFASLDTSGSLTGTSGLYPSAIGHDRVVVAMWAKNLTSGTTSFTVERGYSIAMTATSITLGGATAIWSGGGIATPLMSTMNDGADHLLVMDFVNTGGTNWTLSTSVDGVAFTPQGTQTSGTQALTTIDTAPSASIANGTGLATQWIDELVMWCGNKSTFNQFTTQEIANLTDLANVFGATMDQFQQNFGAPLCWQATAKMSNGNVWRDSGSGPCPPVLRVPRGAIDIVVTDNGNPVDPRIIEG